MAEDGAASIYQQVSARGASPVGLVVSLYDTILRDFRRALAALEAREVETRVFELNHALTVVAHLQSVLNHERGGEAARRFNGLYEVTRGMILEANLKPSRESLDKLIEMYRGLRQAWHRTEQQTVAPEAQPVPAFSPSIPAEAVTAGASNNSPEPRRGNWRA
jgi:flagellar secretion chaperone FliS